MADLLDTKTNKIASLDFNDDEMFQDNQLKIFLNSDVSVNVLLSFFKNSIINCEFLIKCIRRKINAEKSYLNDLVKEYKHIQSDCNGISTSTNGKSKLTNSILEFFKFDNYIIRVRENYINELNNVFVELSNLLSVMMKYRKFFKDKIKVLEKNINEAVTVSEKSKRTYVSLCLDYERFKISKSNGHLDNDPLKMKLSIRGSKTPKEHEAELLKKIENADNDYKEKVKYSTNLRSNLIEIERPDIVNNLISIILEFENVMTATLTKMALLNEKLIVNMGLIISPIDNKKFMSLKTCSENIKPKTNLVNFLYKIIESKIYSNNYVNNDLVPLIYSKHPIMQSYEKKLKKSVSNAKLNPANSRSRSNSASSVKHNNSASLSFVVDPSRNSIPKGLISTHNESPFALSTQPSMMSLNSNSIFETPAKVPSVPVDVSVPLPKSKNLHKISAKQLPKTPNEVVASNTSNNNSQDFPTLDPGKSRNTTAVRIPSLKTIDSDNVSIYSRVRPSPSIKVATNTNKTDNIIYDNEAKNDTASENTDHNEGINDKESTSDDNKVSDADMEVSPEKSDKSEEANEPENDLPSNKETESLNTDKISSPAHTEKFQEESNVLEETTKNNGDQLIDKEDTVSGISSIADTTGNIYNSYKDANSNTLPIFGTSLSDLFNLEQGTVPTIVRQCIHVIEKYGLELEGIYRDFRETDNLELLMAEINTSPDKITSLIPPPNHTDTDIYLIATLLKTFFAKLSEPLITPDAIEGLNVCLSIDNKKTQIDYMHGIIYNFDDAQYWTLRSLLFHLKNVVKNENKNNMNLKAISIIWGPLILPKNETDINDFDYHYKLIKILFDTADQAFETN
ncbi:hypothetical protein TPHA_0O01350 [Tetrapisispora phaffii CBS 4417]|uniref:Rho-GAP domain-containing protein n=1 Tax=Tetrapisispora phaffii (strain ATCC 24235 / CBS 4417 / NBRC 1672 / NRRL Y-8282 / UCD 70-5) TaxID=1071381 RepID=G8C1S5_TETPH|nr:hypothetical protein TPHA_0O01350 [Tetrapisispora phaffii CBS 4417]CCE66103.1 hypothetical protein TPHA_0O01350 [Tetrapisispora phaffii CBS 4417]